MRANCVAPGVILNGFHQRFGMSDDDVEGLKERVKVSHPGNGGRLGENEDVAKVIVFLASNEASFVTGQINLVDGGFSCYNPI